MAECLATSAAVSVAFERLKQTRSQQKASDSDKLFIAGRASVDASARSNEARASSVVAPRPCIVNVQYLNDREMNRSAATLRTSCTHRARP